jgi:DNA-binding response OmpR family regulator
MVLIEGEISVTMAANVEDATDAVAAQIPHVVLLDWDIDGLDGRSILRVIKKNQKSRHVPVLVMTNRATTEALKRELLMYGVQWILEKPIVPLSLPRLIKRTIADGIPPGQSGGLFQRRAILVGCGQTASGAMWNSVW